MQERRFLDEKGTDSELHAELSAADTDSFSKPATSQRLLDDGLELSSPTDLDTSRVRAEGGRSVVHTAGSTTSVSCESFRVS